MKIDIGEITRSFAPRINHNYVRKYFRIDRETNINNDAFYAKMEAQDLPAVHHSEVYKRLYRPAYRVIARQYMEE